MTEDEAKTKICCGSPMVGASVLSHTPGSTQNASFGRCIGSACMAWRRRTVMIDRTTNEPAVLGVSKIESLEKRWSEHGYCGLAGRE